MSPVGVTLAELIDLRRAAASLPLWSRAVASGADHASAFRGRGMEFAETRAYQTGDDIRTLDWRVTARTGRPHTKLFREERERPVLIGVDLRRPMFFATRGAFKSVVATRAAAILAWAAQEHRDRLGGFILADEGQQEIRPQRGRRVALHLLNALADHPAWAAQLPQAAPAARRLAEALTQLRRVTRPGSLVFLLSDFRGWDAAAEKQLGGIAAHSELCLCLVHDPLEAQLPPPGRYPICDAAGRRLTLLGGDSEFAQAYAGRFRERVQRLTDFARGHRIRCLTLRTTDDPLQALRLGLAPASFAHGPGRTALA